MYKKSVGGVGRKKGEEWGTGSKGDHIEGERNPDRRGGIMRGRGVVR